MAKLESDSLLSLFSSVRRLKITLIKAVLSSITIKIWYINYPETFKIHWLAVVAMVGCSHWLDSQFTAYELDYICYKLAVSLGLTSNKCEDSVLIMYGISLKWWGNSLLWAQSSYHVILCVFSDGKCNMIVQFRNEHALFNIATMNTLYPILIDTINHNICNIDTWLIIYQYIILTCFSCYVGHSC